MTYLGLTPQDLLQPLSRVTPDGLGAELGTAPEEAVAERFATAALSTLVEPGDSDAAVLVAALGAAELLTALVERWSADRLLAAANTNDAGAESALAVRGEKPNSSGDASARVAEALQRWRPRLSMRTAFAALDSAAHVGAALVTPKDVLWPTGFGDLGEGAPLALWVRGDPANLRAVNRSIALVGARASTGYGEHVAMESAAGLADRGFAVVSGGAYGIDGAAHRATLASDQTTIAFLAGGVDRLYPSGHTELLTRITRSGLLIGELPCGSSPTKWRFLQRNRLIAAASRATVVVEAGRRSGSLNTAGHAAAIGRPLGAVPGPVTSPASAGCHRLIQEYGAACVTSAAEMAELAGIALDADTPLNDGTGAVRSSAERDESVRLLDALSFRSPRSVGEIAALAGMSEREASAVLGHLELERLVGERDGAWCKLRVGEPDGNRPKSEGAGKPG
jgi:DNA processing protein